MLCAICGGPTVDWVDMPIDAKKDKPTPFARAIRCTACGTGTIEPKPSADQIPELYQLSRYYTHGESHMGEVDFGFADKVLTKFSWWTDRARPFDLADFSRRIGPAGKVLDIGCGGGDLLSKFAALGHDVLGVDPDGDARVEAAERGLTVLAGTGEYLPDAVTDGAFDLVVMSHSLEHCLDPVRALAAARSKVRRGGLLYVEVPNSGCIHFETLLGCSENFDSPRHLWFFTDRGLKQMVEATGLRLVEWRYHGFTRHHAPAWRQWETTIADRLEKHGFAGGRRHGFLRSAAMLLREAFASPMRKYDAMGIVARLEA